MTTGTFLIVLIVAIAFAFWLIKWRREEDTSPSTYKASSMITVDFIGIADEFLYNTHNVPIHEVGQINMRLMRIAPDWAMLIRQFQIIADSIHIAKTSKKPDTAMSRIQGIYESLKECDFSILPLEKRDEYMAYIKQAVANAELAYRLNGAQALLDKAASLKTDKAKTKYYQQAKDLVSTGFGYEHIDQEPLRIALQKIDRAQQGKKVDLTDQTTTQNDIYRNQSFDLLSQATAYKQQKDWAKAVECLRQAYQQFEDISSEFGLETLLRLPLYLQQGGWFDESITEFKKLLDNTESRVAKQFRWLEGQQKTDQINREKSMIYDKMRLASQREKRTDLVEEYRSLSDRYAGLVVGV
jgi:tetratricopeptide (TPR) repeat protein